MSSPGYEHLPGTRLPGGTFTISADDDRRYRELVGGPPAGEGTAHPMWPLIASLRGMGITIGGTLALAGTDIERDGPVLAECEIELVRPLRTGVAYAVTGAIVSLERKSGRSGRFDLLTTRYALADDQGPAAFFTAVNAFPRGREPRP